MDANNTGDIGARKPDTYTGDDTGNFGTDTDIIHTGDTRTCSA